MTITPPSPAAAQPRAVDPAVRGSLSISEQVVETISAVALDEIDEIDGAARRVLGLPLGSDGQDRRPRTSATLAGGAVAIVATVAVSYPNPITATVDRARDHVADRVAALTGLTVRRVDVTVAALTSADRPPTRRELA